MEYLDYHIPQTQEIAQKNLELNIALGMYSDISMEQLQSFVLGYAFLNVEYLSKVSAANDENIPEAGNQGK